MSYFTDADVTIRPLEKWSRPAPTHRRRSNFKTQFSSTMTLLKRELARLGAREIVLQIDVRESDIRLDGWLRANARPSSPRCAIAFQSKFGPLIYYGDAFDDWADNIRAIALGLEALRKVDRYGITSRGEQYTGWKALPAGDAELTPRAAAELIVEIIPEDGYNAAGMLRVAAEYRVGYRRAALFCHPDRGNHADGKLFERLQAAKRVLDLHFADPSITVH